MAVRRKKTKRKTIEQRVEVVVGLELERQLKSVWQRINATSEAVAKHEVSIRSADLRASHELEARRGDVPYLSRDQVVATINRVFDADNVSHKHLRSTLLKELESLVRIWPLKS